MRGEGGLRLGNLLVLAGDKTLGGADQRDTGGLALQALHVDRIGALTRVYSGDGLVGDTGVYLTRLLDLLDSLPVGIERQQRGDVVDGVLLSNGWRRCIRLGG